MLGKAPITRRLTAILVVGLLVLLPLCIQLWDDISGLLGGRVGPDTLSALVTLLPRAARSRRETS